MAAVVLRRLFPPGWALSGRRTLFVGTLLSANKTKAGESDPVKQLFIQKLNEYKTKKSSTGKIPDLSPEAQKQYDSDMERLKRIYGEGDLSKFPKFSFEEKSA